MNWIETTVSSDGGKLQKDKLGGYLLPDDFPLEKGPPGVDESEMIIAGDVDALITAITPKAFLDGHPKVKRLYPDFRSAEQEYYSKTGVFPIMHVIAIRRDFADANPELPAMLFDMYSQAKRARSCHSRACRRACRAGLRVSRCRGPFAQRCCGAGRSTKSIDVT